MHVVTVLFEIHPQHVDEFMHAMTANAAASLALEPGCVQFDVCQSAGTGIDAGCKVFLYELYACAEDFAAHLVAPHFLDFAAQTQAWVVSKTVATYRRVVATTAVLP